MQLIKYFFKVIAFCIIKMFVNCQNNMSEQILPFKFFYNIIIPLNNP